MDFNKLKNRALGLNNNGGLDFMEGKEKGEQIPAKQVLTIREYGFLKGEVSEYVVVLFDEQPNLFYFGGTIVTEKMKSFDNDEDKKTIKSEGLPCLFERKTNKKGKREYTTIEFYPEEIFACS